MSSPVARKPRRKKLGGPASLFISRFRLEDQQSSSQIDMEAAIKQTQKKDVNFYHWKYTKDSAEISTNKRVPKYVKQRDQLLLAAEHNSSSTDQESDEDESMEEILPNPKRRKRSDEVR